MVTVATPPASSRVTVSGIVAPPRRVGGLPHGEIGDLARLRDRERTRSAVSPRAAEVPIGHE
jgi:hypothetical protein